MNFKKALAPLCISAAAVALLLPTGDAPTAAERERPLVDLSALTDPGALVAPKSVPQAIHTLDLLRGGDAGRLIDRIGRPQGLGTGEPDADDPTREYIVPGGLGGTLPVLPESIAFDEKTQSYFTGAMADGAIYRGFLGADRAEVFLSPLRPGRLMVTGVEVDDEGRLYVLTAAQGTLEVYDIATRKRLGVFETGLGGVLNDLVVAPDGDVYITDSLRPRLFRVSAEKIRNGRGSVQRIQLGPDVQYTATPQINGVFNTGGIVAVNKNELIISQINVDKLFRVRLGEGRAKVREIDVRGEFANPDGLELVGDTLYAIDNLGEAVQDLTLSQERTVATVRRRILDDTFALPTGIAKANDRLLVSNGQLFTLPMLAPFTVSNISLK